MKSIIISLVLVFVSLWWVKDDTPFLWLSMHKSSTEKADGIVKNKFTKAPQQVKPSVGTRDLSYYIKVSNSQLSCLGTSRITRDEYNSLSINDSIPILVYKNYCIASKDMRLYAPPWLHVGGAGALFLISLFYLILAMKEFYDARRSVDTESADVE